MIFWLKVPPTYGKVGHVHEKTREGRVFRYLIRRAVELQPSYGSTGYLPRLIKKIKPMLLGDNALAVMMSAIMA